MSQRCLEFVPMARSTEDLAMRVCFSRGAQFYFNSFNLLSVIRQKSLFYFRCVSWRAAEI